MKFRFLTFFLFSLLLTSCGSSKKIVKKNPGKIIIEPIPEKLPSVKQIQHVRKLQKKNKRLNKNTLRYIRKYAPIAVREMFDAKIPASITLAQGILESGSGRGTLARKSNNHFGIKCHKKWKGERVYHDDDMRGECFRKYTYVETSYKDHSDFLTQRKRYRFLFDYNIKKYKKWAKGLKKAGYATDPKYPQKLISIIERYRLYEFDNFKKRKFKRGKKGKKNKKEEEFEDVASYHTVKKGDTLYSIAKRYNLTVKELKKLNKLRGNIINIGQQILIK